MKASKIKVGKTYRNRGAGKTQRTVLEISKDIKIDWYGNGQAPDEPVVRYQQGDKVGELYLSSFASWAGREVASA